MLQVNERIEKELAIYEEVIMMYLSPGQHIAFGKKRELSKVKFPLNVIIKIHHKVNGEFKLIVLQKRGERWRVEASTNTLNPSYIDSRVYHIMPVIIDSMLSDKGKINNYQGKVSFSKK